MIANLITDYLVSSGHISAETAEIIAEEMKKVRVKLGLIAVHEGLMTEYQSETVNVLQATMDKRFGDIAVEKGFLTENQVQELLKKQGDPYLAVAQALENLGIMQLNELDQIMKRYQVENELPASSLEALKSDNIDRIVPLYLPAEADDYQEIALLSVKTVMRCIDNEVFLSKAYFTDELECRNGSLQFVDGDPCLTLGMAGEGDALLGAASAFGHEDFPCVNMDALDAIAEFNNCVCGLYVSAASLKQIKMELYPPEYSDDISSMEGTRMLVFPMRVKNGEVNLVICVGEKVEFR